MTEPLLITCPDCGTVIDATRIARGTEFSCNKCSKRLPVPWGIFLPPKGLAGRAMTIVGACAFLGCVSLGTLMGSPNFAAEEARARRMPAQRLVRALCWSEVFHHETKPWLAVPEAPAEIPAKTLPFTPDAALRELGFVPKESPLQYSVSLTGESGVECVARSKAGGHDSILRARATNSGVEDSQ
jgi:hypothetical protein